MNPRRCKNYLLRDPIKFARTFELKTKAQLTLRNEKEKTSNIFSVKEQDHTHVKAI